MSDAYWRQPLNWAAAARAAGVRRRVFCASMADVFERRDDLVPHRLRLWGLIAATADALDWLLLTKRPENAGALVPWGPFGVTPEQWIAGEHEGMGHAKPWPNVWGGVTTENQEEADRRLVHILGDESRPRTVDFAVTFASYEPALERVTFDGSRGGRNWLDAPGLDWIIVGDESGTGRRPADLEWVRAARDQADAAGVGFHFKQWCGPDAAGLAGDRVKGKIHLPVLDGVVHSAGPTGSVL
jgi:protein gp37